MTRVLDVHVSWEDGLCLLALSGEARMETLAYLDEAEASLERRGVTRVLADLHGLAFMDSAATGHLLRLHARLEERGGRLVLFALQRVVARLIERLGLTQLHVAEDEAAAREQLA